MVMYDKLINKYGYRECDEKHILPNVKNNQNLKKYDQHNICLGSLTDTSQSETNKNNPSTFGSRPGGLREAIK